MADRLQEIVNLAAASSGQELFAFGDCLNKGQIQKDWDCKKVDGKLGKEGMIYD